MTIGLPRGLRSGWAVLLLAFGLPGRAQGEGAAEPPSLGPSASLRTARPSASLELAMRYNSNLELTDPSAAGTDFHRALGLETQGRLGYARNLTPAWTAEAQLSGLGTLHRDHPSENWYYSRGAVAVRRQTATTLLEASSDVRYYTAPCEEAYDFLRGVTLVSCRRAVSPHWQLGAGLGRVFSEYPHAVAFDYHAWSAFLEARRRWSPDLSGYCQVEVQTYEGTAVLDDPDAPTQGTPAAPKAPDDGSRRTARLGMDWLVHGRHSLSLGYSVESDRANLGVNQIGNNEGHEETQDYEAEFDLVKHKGTILYTVPLTSRTVFSSYLEVIRKAFDDDDSLPDAAVGQHELLLLTSNRLTVKLSDQVSLRGRYLYRTRVSTRTGRDYQDHIFSLGIGVTY